MNKAIELVQIPGAIMEQEPKFRIMFRGQPWGELYFNMRGYVAERGIPVPSAVSIAEGVGRPISLDIGERSLAQFKSEIAKANRDWDILDKQGVQE